MQNTLDKPVKNKDRTMSFICEKCGHRKEYILVEVPGMEAVLEDERQEVAKTLVGYMNAKYAWADNLANWLKKHYGVNSKS